MKNYYGLIGSYSNNDEQGIYSFTINNNKIENINLKTSVNNPTYLCNTDKLFTVLSKENLGGVGLINFSNKANPIISSVLDEGKQPCHISCNPRKKALFSSNYHTGEVKYYTFSDKSLTLIDTLKGNEKSKMHFASYIPKTDKGIAIDLGNDELVVFGYDYSLFKDFEKSIKLKENCGPRHLVFHPSMKFLFVLTEYSSEIVTVKIDSDLTLSPISYTKALPNNLTNVESFGGAIRISNNGKYIFSSNRGHNSISVFEFNEETEALTLINNYETKGDHPRDFNLTPDDEYLLIANTFSDNLTLYKHDLMGNLELLQDNIYCNKPTCVLFL